MEKIRQSDITVQYRLGWLLLSVVTGGSIRSQFYMDYTVRQAKREFLRYLRSEGVAVAGHSYPNIEPRKAPGCDYRLGYAAGGAVPVRIFGTPRTGYTLQFGASETNRKNGTMFNVIPGRFASLQAVSEFLSTFKGVER